MKEETSSKTITDTPNVPAVVGKRQLLHAISPVRRCSAGRTYLRKINLSRPIIYSGEPYPSFKQAVTQPTKSSRRSHSKQRDYTACYASLPLSELQQVGAELFPTHLETPVPQAQVEFRRYRPHTPLLPTSRRSLKPKARSDRSLALDALLKADTQASPEPRLGSSKFHYFLSSRPQTHAKKRVTREAVSKTAREIWLALYGKKPK